MAVVQPATPEPLPQALQEQASPRLTVRHRRRARRAPYPLFLFGATAAFSGLVILYYFAAVHAVAPDSDHASVFLQGYDVSKGNVLLHGWRLTPDSFWTIDTLFYAVGSLAVGVRSSLLAAVPAVIDAAVVVIGVRITLVGRTRGARIAGALTVGTLLVLASHSFDFFYLQSALHIGTVLWALVAFLALRRGRFGAGFAVGVAFLTAGVLGDLLMIAYGVLPVCLAGLLVMVRQRSLRAGAAPFFAALCSTALAVSVRVAVSAFGGFTLATAHATAKVPQVLHNLANSFNLLAQLTGARTSDFSSGGAPALLGAAHILGAAFLLCCFLEASVRLVAGLVAGVPRMALVSGSARKPKWHEPAGPRIGRADRFLDEFLILACIGSFATFLWLATSSDPLNARYLAPTVVFASVLGGRVVGRWWERIGSPTVRWGAASLGLATALSFGACLGYNLSAPAPVSPVSRLVSYLETRHLSEGVGDYWSASITTVESDDRVQVRPVIATGARGRLARFPVASSADWYTGQRFQFLVYDADAVWGGVDSFSAKSTWGKPSRVLMVGDFRVLLWGSPVSVGAGVPRSS